MGREMSAIQMANENHFESLQDEPAVVTLTKAISTVRNTDPMDLPTLYESIPVETVSTLDDAGDDITVRFPYEEMTITVHGDGKIVIQESE